MMFITSWQLTLVALAILPLSLSVTIFIAKNSQKRFKAYYAKLGMLNGLIEENYSGYKIVKLFNKENETVKTFRNINTDLAKADRMSQFFSGIIFPAINFVNNLGFVGIAVVGGLINNIGNMVAFFILVGLFQRPFQMLGKSPTLSNPRLRPQSGSLKSWMNRNYLFHQKMQLKAIKTSRVKLI